MMYLTIYIQNRLMFMLVVVPLMFLLCYLDGEDRWIITVMSCIPYMPTGHVDMKILQL